MSITISGKELSAALKGKGIIISSYQNIGTVKDISVFLADCKESFYVPITSNNCSIVILSKEGFIRLCKKLGWTRVTRKELEQIFVLMHEIGHAKCGPSESTADEYALSNTNERIRIKAIYSQMVAWYGLEEKTIDQQATFWANFAGLLEQNDPHKTVFRFEVMSYALSELKKLQKKMNG